MIENTATRQLASEGLIAVIDGLSFPAIRLKLSRHSSCFNDQRWSLP
jgi:hypothetical protein